MRSLLTLLVPAFALSLGAFACSGSDSTVPSDDPSTQQVASELADEGHECSVEHKCKAGLACVARVAGGDLGTKGLPCPDPTCGVSSSTSSSSGTSGATSSSSSSGWSSSTSSSGASGTSGWSSSTSSSGASGTSGWSSSSSSGGTAEVGVCITIH